jgi:hypothetical protein
MSTGNEEMSHIRHSFVVALHPPHPSLYIPVGQSVKRKRIKSIVIFVIRLLCWLLLCAASLLALLLLLPHPIFVVRVEVLAFHVQVHSSRVKLFIVIHFGVIKIRIFSK